MAPSVITNPGARFQDNSRPGAIKDIPSIAVLSNITILSREKFSHRTPYVASPTRSLVRR